MIEPETLEHLPQLFELALHCVRQAQREHGIEDLIVTVERAGKLQENQSGVEPPHLKGSRRLAFSTSVH
jgi:hypothetical protein